MKSKLNTALVAAAMMLISTPAFAEDGGSSLKPLGMGLAMGMAVIGAGLGQGKAATAALESIGRNPQAADKVQTPMLIGLVFMETLVLFTFGLAFVI